MFFNEKLQKPQGWDPADKIQEQGSLDMPPPRTWASGAALGCQSAEAHFPTSDFRTAC